ncbi:MAG TPA: LysR family transcriptional regulator [Burkholderiaceae bacterium]|nr:LysR family transcriptional regulator [Burkholderiaceae bacterium]
MNSLVQRSLTLRHLRLISVLGRTLNLSRCAQSLNTTQPAVSRALAQIESLLQVRLFERTTKRVVATPAGLSMVAHADRVLNELVLAETTLGDLRRGVSGELRIGVLSVFSARRVAQAAIRTARQLPDVRLQVQTLELDELYAALLAGRLDVMLAHAELAVDLNRVEVMVLYEEHSTIVAAPDHRLARRRRIGWPELANERWVLPAPNAPLRPKVDRMLSIHRAPAVQAGVDLQVSSVLVALALVRESAMLWAVASDLAHDYERAGLVRCLPMPGDLLRGPMCAFRLRDDRVPAQVRVFVQSLSDGVHAAV